MRVDVADRAHQATRRRDEQIIVSAGDTDPGGMGQGSAVHDTRGRREDVAVVHDDTVAVHSEWGVNGAGRGVFSVQCGASSCGEGGGVLMAAVGA